MLLYSLLLAVALLLAAPWWIFRLITTERYRDGLQERLGRIPASLSLDGRRILWVHAVSVGEVLAATSLVTALERELGPGWKIVVSTTTRTGQEMARTRFGAERVFYFPLDFRFAVHAWMRVLRPELVILMESELWPRFLHECSRAGVPVAVVNARVSDRSLRRALRVRPAWRWMAHPVTLWLAQSDADAARLLRLGAPQDAVRSTGNLKYDTPAPRESPLVEAIRRGAAGRPVVVAGSTVYYGTTPEEGIVLDAFKSHIWPEMPDVLLILAPRHPQRFSEADVLAKQFGTTRCATDVPLGDTAPRLRERILILDTIGDLAALYRLADVAFVGGSLIPHGGHNPLEPAQFGVPVVVGPHMSNFRDIVARMQQADGIEVLEGTEPDALGEVLAHLLANPAEARTLGACGRAVFEQQKGATARTVDALLPLLRAHAEPDARATEARQEEALP